MKVYAYWSVSIYLTAEEVYSGVSIHKTYIGAEKAMMRDLEEDIALYNFTLEKDVKIEDGVVWKKWSWSDGDHWVSYYIAEMKVED